ncbi:MAG: transposase [Deltaproteobacteria bacterium]|nr:transposase [Deltaproteobacteria bacterium]
MRACTIAAIVCSPRRFSSKFKFWAYSMLAKYTNTSDGVVYSKKKVPGNRVLKNVFLGAAQKIIDNKKGKAVYGYSSIDLCTNLKFEA